MYAVGDLARVHANGRINYANQPPTHADGREFGADKALAAAERLRRAAVRAFGGEGKEEEELDAALDAVLEAEMEGEMEGDDGSKEEDDDDGAVTPPWEPAEEGEGKTSTAAAVGGADAPQEKPPPRNFSRVLDPLHPDREAFPLFPPQPPVEASVAPGAMLYLPAGWFHEVGGWVGALFLFGSKGDGRGNGLMLFLWTERGWMRCLNDGWADGRPHHALSNQSNPNNTKQVISSGGVHAAVNWWFHPPDNLTSFEEPYTSPFWPRDWEERMALTKEEEEGEG